MFKICALNIIDLKILEKKIAWLFCTKQIREVVANYL